MFFISCSAQLCIKKGMMIIGEITGGMQGFIAVLPVMITNFYLWISAICYVVSILLWLVVLSKVDVSYAYPFSSIGYILSAVVGTLVWVIGIIVICVDIILILRS